MNHLPVSAKKGKIKLVPLEEELAQAHRRREVTNQLLEAKNLVDQLLRGGQLDGDHLAALEKFRRALDGGLSTVKNFRA
ncbi:MAG: hypothetical protein LBT98_01775 [Puniceicoccales bacterium]|jgi:hypothetical protein|nr:hypothetical protein [Puniceicoccales bacterium]